MCPADHGGNGRRGHGHPPAADRRADVHGAKPSGQHLHPLCQRGDAAAAGKPVPSAGLGEPGGESAIQSGRLPLHHRRRRQSGGGGGGDRERTLSGQDRGTYHRLLCGQGRIRHFRGKSVDALGHRQRGAADIASVSRDHCSVLPPCHPSHGSAGTGVSAGEKRRARL